MQPIIKRITDGDWNHWQELIKSIINLIHFLRQTSVEYEYEK